MFWRDKSFGLPRCVGSTSSRFARALSVLCAGAFCSAASLYAENRPSPVPNMFEPTSTPAIQEITLSYFVMGITLGILVVVGLAWAYVVFKFRAKTDSEVEPPQLYGSMQVELAWTVIPFILVVVLFLTTARMIFAVQDKPETKDALNVTVIGHQFWWEFKYPKYGIVTAGELHVPLSTDAHPMPTFLKLESADTWHSFWVPQLAGKQDNIPDHVNSMWIDPHVPGMYVGQCGQFCGVEHAKMLIRVYVDTPDQFQRWVADQEQPALQDPNPEAVAGKQVFETQACMNCHQIEGTSAHGKFGPDLTHFGSRDTLASGAAPNDMNDLVTWIRNPDALKPGALMPPMQLDETQLEQVAVYLHTLK